MATVVEALGEFEVDDTTCKMLRAIYTVIPYSPELPHFTSVDDAVRSLDPSASSAVIGKARDIAGSTEELTDMLWMANLMDRGDRGLTVAAGLFTALKLFRGKGRDSFDNDKQQRNDAVLKALGISYLVHKAYPGSITEKMAAFKNSPTGQAIAVYYGAVEVALPFADNAAVEGADFLSNLFSAESQSQATRLARMAGGQSISGATDMLATLTGPLQQVVDHATKFVEPVANAAGPYVPGLLSATDKVAGLVASAADVMPVYRLLGARMAAESAALRALS